MNLVSFKRAKLGDSVSMPGDFDRVITKITKTRIYCKYPGPDSKHVGSFAKREMKPQGIRIWALGAFNPKVFNPKY